MDGNRTHPGRLSSAPQTVLKTVGPASTTVHRSPSSFEPEGQDSRAIRHRPRPSADLAVMLAVTGGCFKTRS